MRDAEGGGQEVDLRELLVLVEHIRIMYSAREAARVGCVHGPARDSGLRVAG